MAEKLYYRITDKGLPEVSDKPALLSADDDAQVCRKSNIYISSKQVGSFNQKYIVKNESNAEKPYDWDVKMLFIIKDLKQSYPHAVVLGHRDLPGVHKACPCFDARAEYDEL